MQPPQTIELLSDLGGGKTTFVKGLAKGLGYKGDVASPTFTLSREYPCSNGLTLFHYDFYRLDSAGIVAAELEETINTPKSVNVIEWADAVENVLPVNRIKISFKLDANDLNKRQITVSGPILINFKGL